MSLTPDEVDAALANSAENQPEIMPEPEQKPEAKSIARRTPTALGERGADLQDTEQMLTMARAIHAERLAPSSYKTPAQVMLGMIRVRELGLDGVGGLQSTYIVNNRVAIYGDAAMSLVYRSGQLADVLEEWYDDDERGRVAVCEVTRYAAGGAKMKPFRVEFSQADARAAGLGNRGPWTSYIDSMLMWRARHFAMRGRFPDLLMGCDWAHNVGGTVDVIGGPPNVSGNDKLADEIGVEVAQ